MRHTARSVILISSLLGLAACATMPEVREIEGPIVLDAPDAVVTVPSTPSKDTQQATQSDDGDYENVQTVPVTPINCPSGTSPQADGSCMYIN